MSWQSPGESTQVFDKSAFVFSMTMRSKHPIAQNIGYSLTHDPEMMAVFCGGFGISQNCPYT